MTIKRIAYISMCAAFVTFCSLQSYSMGYKKAEFRAWDSEFQLKRDYDERLHNAAVNQKMAEMMAKEYKERYEECKAKKD